MRNANRKQLISNFRNDLSSSICCKSLIWKLLMLIWVMLQSNLVGGETAGGSILQIICRDMVLMSLIK